MKLILTGTHGTGKSTVMKGIIDEYNLTMITDVSRLLYKEGNKISENGDFTSQLNILLRYIKEFEENDNYISSRGVTDVLAYSWKLRDMGNITHEEITIIEDLCEDFFSSHLDIIYFYIPIEFELTEVDPVRPQGEEYREWIDRYIIEVLHKYCIPHVVLFGNSEKKIETIKTFI